MSYVPIDTIVFQNGFESQNYSEASRTDLQTIYMKQIAKYKKLTRDEEIYYTRIIKKGGSEAPVAMQNLVQANLRFVISVATKYQYQGLPLLDLINEGNLGLMEAAKRFDENKGYKFISYAVWWIRQSILGALSEQSRFMKIPLNRIGELHNLGKLDEKLAQKLQRLPLVDDYSKILKKDRSDIEELLISTSSSSSLDTSFDPTGKGESDTTLYDLLSSEQTSEERNRELDYATQTFNSAFKLYLGKKKNNERMIKTENGKITMREYVLREYYGLNNSRTGKTLEQIANKLGLTRERVRQIKEKSEQALMNHKEYFNDVSDV
ncbi:MAG: RNA polymerase sigma factor RpoD/SigA [Candidatus Woesearchaeota archaeon]|jgi:RNA polymerase primary sigma factor